MANDLTEKPKAAGETYDDQPFHSDNLPPEVRAPLAGFDGAEPPSPQWFKDAIAQEPERGFVTSHGAKLEVLTWGELGKPGLLRFILPGAKRHRMRHPQVALVGVVFHHQQTATWLQITFDPLQNALLVPMEVQRVRHDNAV